MSRSTNSTSAPPQNRQFMLPLSRIIQRMLGATDYHEPLTTVPGTGKRWEGTAASSRVISLGCRMQHILLHRQDTLVACVTQRLAARMGRVLCGKVKTTR